MQTDYPFGSIEDKVFKTYTALKEQAMRVHTNPAYAMQATMDLALFIIYFGDDLIRMGITAKSEQNELLQTA